MAAGSQALGPSLRRRRRSLSGIGWVALVAFVLMGCSGGDDIRDAQGVVVAPGGWPVFDLRDGDCLDPDPELSGEISEIAVVPCDSPHTQEVFATVEHPPGVFPGAGAVSVWADGACLSELESTLGLTLDDGVFISYLLPTFDEWNRNDDRRAICVLVFPDRAAAVGSFVAGTAGAPRNGLEPPPRTDATSDDASSDDA